MGALDGKVAIVTGGTSGIGRRIVEVFAEEGAKVVVAARREDEGGALEKLPGVRFCRTDVSIEADVKGMVDRTVEWFGRVDCLVNNAGIATPMCSITEIDVAALDRVFAVNVRGVLLCIKHTAPVMLSQGAGSIVNVSSMSGLRGGLSCNIYTASKGAVHALTRSAAAELGEKGIRVNSISPGAIVTGMFGKAAGIEAPKADRVASPMEEAYARLQPIPRAGLPDDVAKAAVFLASDGSSFVNGHDLVVDGGYTAVSRHWSFAMDTRAQLSKRIKDAAAAL